MKVQEIHSDQLEARTSNSNPKYYAGPNPYFGDPCNLQAPLKPIKKPYSAPIAAGKNTYVYDAHTYHTKVPPQGIEALIEHYTNPGDVVLDPFCGSGMTGVAATRRERKALLSDISPAAVFIAYNLNTPIDSVRYKNAVEEVLSEVSMLEESLYSTRCRKCGQAVRLLYTVWSYGVICSGCNREFILWDVARDERARVRESKIKTEFKCPHCRKHLRKRDLKRTCIYPMAVGYKCCEAGPKEQIASPDRSDLETLRRIEAAGVPNDLWYPRETFPEGVNTHQPIASGITSVDKAYTPRALWALAYLWQKADRWPDPELRMKLLFTLTSLYQRVTVFSEFRFWGGSGNTANLNVPAIMNEQNVFKAFARKAATIAWYFESAPRVPRFIEVSTQSACHLTQVPDKSVDYVFTDPPFGGNINYSEMNFLWESWLGVRTDISEEAIINRVQRKGVEEYRLLLARAFREVRRVLKDGAWLTVIFHNSSAQVWQALQHAIIDAGFSIEGTQTFDKRHGTFKQFVSNNAVGYDLVLHCQKALNKSRLPVRDDEEVRRSATEFMRKEIARAPEDYRTRYLHVARREEFNFRKLYANWLTRAVRQSLVGLSFEEFQDLASGVLATNQ
jgi:DNA modification methylase